MSHLQVPVGYPDSPKRGRRYLSLPPRLHAERLQFVFTREDAPAAFVLLGARKNGRAALRVEKRTLPAT